MYAPPPLSFSPKRGKSNDEAFYSWGVGGAKIYFCKKSKILLTRAGGFLLR
jgi:hypothetical protein